MSDSTAPLADFSQERREHVLRWLVGEGVATNLALSYEARIYAAVGALICDSTGRFADADLKRALADPSIVQVARALLREARNG